MSYQERDNGTHAMMCDTDSCHADLIAPTKDDAYNDANLAGWVSSGTDSNTGAELHVCSHCSRGVHPGAALLKRMLGGDTVKVKAPCGVNKGDEVRDDDDNLVGHYEADAQQGETVEVKVKFPEVTPPTSASAPYAAMMEGVDDDDDASGLRSVVAPSNDTVLRRAPVEAQATLTIDAKSPEGEALMQALPADPSEPQINQGVIDDAAAAFDGISSGSWDPDADD